MLIDPPLDFLKTNSYSSYFVLCVINFVPRPSMFFLIHMGKSAAEMMTHKQSINKAFPIFLIHACALNNMGRPWYETMCELYIIEYVRVGMRLS